MKKLACFVLTAVMAAAMALPAYAGRVETTGNGYTEYFDDGTYLEYNARGSEYTYHDSDGVYSWYDDDVTQSSVTKTNKNAKYAGSRITDCYWSYSNGNLIAKWDADYRSKATYTVTLYHGGKKVTSKTSNGGSNVNFSQAVADRGQTGYYYFKVKAKWPGKYTDEDESSDYHVDGSKLNAIQNRHSGGGSSGSSSGSSSGGPGSTASGSWQQYGKRYYFDAYGNMAANQWIVKADNPHIYYYVGPNGDMLTNQYIGQWYVNANGECYF